jgi:hypothetical protein
VVGGGKKKSTHSRGEKVGKHHPMFTLSRGKGGSREKKSVHPFP